MTTVELDKAAIEPLKAEATCSMETSIEKCYRFRGVVHKGWQERNLLACADVLGALERASLAFGVFDQTTPDGDRPETVPVEFTEEAIRWMSWTRDLTREHVDHVDTASTDGELDGCQQEEFLLNVLNRLLGRKREAVKA
jgi:hypothetical protein